MTTTSQVSLGKFYQFLNQQGINTAEDVVNAMDGVGDFGNTDGVVIKAEFSAFMKDTWDELLLGEMSDKAINTFWNRIDAQKSAKTVGGTNMKDLNALNENEAAAVEKQIACYEVLNQFMANVALPAEACGLGIDNRAFKNSINDSLMETCQRVITANKNKSVDEIRQLIQEALAEAYPTAAKKTVANLLANGDNGLIKLLSSKPELANLENKAFDDLQAIVDKYIQNRAADPNINLAQVINELTYIINQYFVNAGVNTGITANVNNPSELNEYTQLDGMSDLQNARLSAKMNEALASANLNTGDLQCPQEYVDHYKEVFINSKLNSGASFTDLMNQNNLANEFVNFQINGVTVKKLIDLHINAANMNVDWVFHECLCDKPNTVNETGVFYGMSEAAADAIFANLPFTDLPKSAHQKIMDGEIKSKKDLYDYYVEEIKKDLAKYVGSSSAMSVEDAYNIYNDSYNSIRADQTSSASEKLTNLKKAAITFCDTIAAKGDIVKNAIKQVFGTEDYKSKINNSSTPSEIHGWVTQLKDKLAYLNNASQSSDQVNTGEYTGTVRLGSDGNDNNDYYFNLKNAIADAKSNLHTLLEDMAYKLSLQGVDTASALTTTTSYYDNIFDAILEQESSIENKDTRDTAFMGYAGNHSYAIIRQNTTSKCNEIFDTGNINSGSTGIIISCAEEIDNWFSNSSFRIDIDQAIVYKKLLENAGQIQNSTQNIDNCSIPNCFFAEFNKEKGWSTDSRTAISNFRTKIGQKLYEAAIKDGYSETSARNAMHTLNSFYENAIKALDNDRNGYGARGKSFTYTDYSTNTTVTCNDKSQYKQSGKESAVNELADFSEKSSTGLYVGCDDTATDAFAFFIEPAVVIEKFKSFLH